MGRHGKTARAEPDVIETVRPKGLHRATIRVGTATLAGDVPAVLGIPGHRRPRGTKVRKAADPWPSTVNRAIHGCRRRPTAQPRLPPVLGRDDRPT
jgi:hypothetical protein